MKCLCFFRYNNTMRREELFKNRRAVLVIAMILIAFLLSLFIFRSELPDRSKQYPLFELDGNWTITKNGERLPERDLYRLETPGVLYGDKWVLETKLPSDNVARISGAALYFHTLQSAVRVSVGGEEIYTYGTDRYAERRMLKRGICLIPLPDSYPGKDLRIEITASEPIAFNGLGPILFGNEEELFLHFMELRRVPLFLGVFLCIYALFQMFFLPILLADMRRLLTPLIGSLLSLTMGLYILCYYYLVGIMTRLENLNTFLEYLTLYLLPLCFSIYLYTVLGGRLKKLYQFFAELDAGLLFAALMLHVMNLAHITLYLQFFYIITFLESAPYLIGARGYIRRQQEIMPDTLSHVARIIVYFGFFIYLVCSLLDTVMYAYAKFIGGAEPEHGIPFFSTGAIVFTLSVTIQYFLQGISHLRADVIKQRLEERAYTDGLTGLANRTRCELEMQKMTVAEPFVIISMDVDN